MGEYDVDDMLEQAFKRVEDVNYNYCIFNIFF